MEIGSLYEKSKTSKIDVLLDTGCAKSAMPLSTYKELIDQGIDLKFSTAPNVTLSTCTGQKNKICGTAKLRIHFNTMFEIFYDLEVMVVPQLQEKFILGNDFLGSDVVTSIQQDSLKILIPQTNETFGVPMSCKLATTTIFYPNFSCSLMRDVVVPAQSHKNVRLRLPRDGDFKHKVGGQYLVANTHVEGLETLDAMYTLRLSKTLTLPVYNNTSEDIHLSMGSEVCSIEFCHEQNYKANFLRPDQVYLNHTVGNSIPDFISEDEHLNEAEKLQASEKFETTGRHQQSMSHYVEKHSGLTEMALADVKPMTEREFEEQFDLKHLPSDHRKKFLQIFKRNKQAFSMSAKDIGKAKDIEMDIELDRPQPRIQKYIPIPHTLRPQVRQILDQLLKFGVIRKCPEPSLYCSNLICVKKKDGKDIRIIFDGRPLNMDTTRLPMMLITKQEVMAHMCGKEIVSTLDVSDAFFTIPLKAEAQPLTAFWSESLGDRFCFTRAPQGLKNSPLYLKLLMDKIFGDLAHYVLHYADDLLIATDGDMANHQRVVEEVLRRLIKAGLKARPAKLNVARESIEFLGVIWKKGVTSIPEAKLQAFTQLPSPNTPKKAKSILCTLSYYRHYIPRFAELSKPLLDVANVHPKQFQWTEDLEKCLRTLIQTFIENAKLYLPDPAKTFYVQTDASQYCASGRVFQKNEAGEEQIISAFSRTFTRTERAYGILKKEVLSLLYTLKSMDFFLRFANQLVILVDAKSIIYLRMCKDSEGILMRFSLELSKYPAKIFHVAGQDNEIADLLSRAHPDIKSIEDEIKARRPLDQKKAMDFLKKLTIPDGYEFSEEEVKLLLEGDSLPDPSPKPKRKSKAKEGERPLKNTSKTLTSRNIKTPVFTKNTNRPGALLPEGEAEKLQGFEDKPRQGPRKGRAVSKREQPAKSSLKKQGRATPPSRNVKISALQAFPWSDSDSNSSDIELDVPQTSTPDTDLDVTPMPDTQDSTVQDLLNRGIEPTVPTTEIQTVSHFITKGLVSLADFIEAQSRDDFCIELREAPTLKHGFSIKNGVIFFKSGPKLKPVLPKSLILPLINTKHFSIYGMHSTPARIERDIKDLFYTKGSLLKDSIMFLQEKCFICQIFSTKKQDHVIQETQFAECPRQAWACDIMPSFSTTKRGNSVILLAVDMYTAFVLCIAMPDRKSETLIKAIRDHIILPFGTPKVLRSDEEGSMYNSRVFYKFLQTHNIKLLPTARASPFSNGLAETSIKSIKHAVRKIILQEKWSDVWDEYLSFFVEAHNNSVSVDKISPAELQFGFRSPTSVDLIQFYPLSGTQSEYHERIAEITERNLKLHNDRAKKRAKSQRTVKNKNKLLKEFVPGMVCLERQNQVSTGKTSSSLAPVFTGPYLILRVNKTANTCDMEHMVTGEISKSHFTNIQPMHFTPGLNRLNDNFIEDLFDKLPEKDTLKNYPKEHFVRERDIILDPSQYEIHAPPAIDAQSPQSSQQISSGERGTARPDTGRLCSPDEIEVLESTQVASTQGESTRYLSPQDESTQTGSQWLTQQGTQQTLDDELSVQDSLAGTQTQALQDDSDSDTSIRSYYNEQGLDYLDDPENPVDPTLNEDDVASVDLDFIERESQREARINAELSDEEETFNPYGIGDVETLAEAGSSTVPSSNEEEELPPPRYSLRRPNERRKPKKLDDYVLNTAISTSSKKKVTFRDT